MFVLLFYCCLFVCDYDSFFAPKATLTSTMSAASQKKKAEETKGKGAAAKKGSAAGFKKR